MWLKVRIRIKTNKEKRKEMTISIAPCEVRRTSTLNMKIRLQQGHTDMNTKGRSNAEREEGMNEQTDI